jgi:hypothetical protein
VHGECTPVCTRVFEREQEIVGEVMTLAWQNVKADHAARGAKRSPKSLIAAHAEKAETEEAANLHHRLHA